MLQIIRDKTSGAIAIGIVALLIVTFAFWGVSYYFDQGGSVVAVSVNDAQIDLQEYQRVSQNVRRKWQELVNNGGGNVDDELVKQQTLDSLIERELVIQVNDSLNMRVSAQQVREVINGVQTFHGLNGFDNSIYERSVGQLGFTTVMFERQIQEDMKAEQLQSAIVESVFVTDDEVRLLASLNNQSRDISYSIISSNQIKEAISLSEEEISDFYDKNSRDYLEPEQVKIAYLELSLQKMASEIEVDENELLNYYEANKANYEVEDQRKIRHITISIDEKATQEEISKTAAKADELIAQLKEGKSFEELSVKYSDDLEYKIEISELGFLTKGIMDAEIDEVMFSLSEGELSAPIITKKSIDVIKLEQIKGGEKNTFENVREAVKQAYSLSISENQFFEANDLLANLSYEHPDTLEIAAEELGLEIKESEYFNRTSQSDPILSDSKIISASFSEDVLNGNNSEVIEVGNNRVFVIRMIDHKSEHKQPLDAVRERVITRMKYEQASAQVKGKGEAVLEKLKSGADPEQLAAEFGIEWKQSDEVKRDNSGINRSVLRTAFKLGRPSEGQTIFGGTSLGSGDYALVIVNSVNDPEPSSFTTEELTAIRTQLQQLEAANNWRQLVKDLRTQAKVEIFSDRL
ncbi:MAG: peptidyl-prolyl cis-trans isomerase D [Planctomycetota bacterium]|jgi:peptidyl-prolyl cis-trans isomerase D